MCTLDEWAGAKHGLAELDLRRVYDSDATSLIDEFYVPSLSASKEYDRLTGFFSSTSLATSARGVAGLIVNRGHIRLLTSPYLTKRDIDTIRDLGRNTVIEKALLGSIQELKSKIESDYVSALGWMLREGYMELRVAMVVDDSGELVPAEKIESSGIFHQKVGILRDESGNSVSFSGSINETAMAWLSNIEEFKVFRSWVETERPYLEADVDKFERYWNGRSQRVRVEDAPSAVSRELIARSPRELEDLAVLRNELNRPKLCGDNPNKKLWPHQVAAARKWVEAGRRGILEMATGTGKTLAALACICDAIKERKRLLVVIAAPYRHIGDQWRNAINDLKAQMTVITADSASGDWESSVVDCGNKLMLEAKDCAVVITTHTTLGKKRFQECIERIQVSKLLVVDEVHGAGAPVRAEGLSDMFELRLGLSATPRRWFDDEGTSKLLDYFSGVVYELPLSGALRLRNPETGTPILVPYNYHPYFVDLNDDELLRYRDLTSRIGKMYHVAKSDSERSDLLALLLNKREDIIRNAAEKFDVLDNVLTELQKSNSLNRMLIYCAPQQIEQLQSLLISRNVKQHKFTQEESVAPDEEGLSQRARILRRLETGEYQALVAIRCLDEGVDVPCIDKAILLASTGNPRQYIQRRGRILRFAPGKKSADIYDVVVLPSLSSDPESRRVELKIIQKEMNRYEEFAQLALNRESCMRVITEAEIRIGLFGDVRR